jgi:hypothetical protein
MLPGKVAPMLPIDPRQVDRTFALDKPNHLRYRILRWDRNQHMHMIYQQMAFLNLALLLPS